jgi:Rod binding domain-containing protein
MMSGPNLLIQSLGPASAPESAGAGPGVNKIDEGKLKKVCGDFESIFIAQMLKEMRKTIPKSGLLDGGSQQDMYLSLFDEELSKNLAKRGGLGLGKILYQNIMKQGQSTDLPPAERSTPAQGQGQKNILAE